MQLTNKQVEIYKMLEERYKLSFLIQDNSVFNTLEKFLYNMYLKLTPYEMYNFMVDITNYGEILFKKNKEV